MFCVNVRIHNTDGMVVSNYSVDSLPCCTLHNILLILTSTQCVILFFSYRISSYQVRFSLFFSFFAYARFFVPYFALNYFRFLFVLSYLAETVSTFNCFAFSCAHYWFMFFVSCAFDFPNFCIMQGATYPDQW